MNPRLRTVLIIIGVITLTAIAIILFPRSLSMYYQIKGGQQIEYVLRFEEGIDELVCEELPSTNQEGLEEVKDAVSSLIRSTRSNRNNAQAYYYLGKAYCLLGEPEVAKDYYQEYSELRPKNPIGYIELGFVHEKLGNPISAKNAWEKAGLTPFDFNTAGNEKLSKENYDDALLWYERSLLLNPRNFGALFGIGSIKESQTKWQAAIAVYKSVIDYDPSNIDAHYRIGEILLNQLYQFEESLFYFETASNIDDLPVKAYVGIGDANNRLGNIENALSAYQHAVDLSHKVDGNSIDDQWERVWPYYALGSLQLNLGYYEKARDSFLMGIHLDTNNQWSGWLFWGLGRVSLLTEDYDQANLHFEHVLEETNYFFLRSQALFGLGQSNILLGDIDEGLDLIKLAQIEHPENRNLHIDYIYKLIYFGKTEEAMMELTHLIDKWPDDEEAQQLIDGIRN